MNYITFHFFYTGFNIRSTDFNANIGIEQPRNKEVTIKETKILIDIRNLKDFLKQSSDLK